MSLLDECLTALEGSYTILETDAGSRIFDLFQDDWPFTSWGRINWEAIQNKVTVDLAGNIESYLEEFISLEISSQEIYVLWDEGSLPVLKSNLSSILSVIDDVTAVSFDTWLYDFSTGYVVEFYHEGQITLGLKHKKG